MSSSQSDGTGDGQGDSGQRDDAGNGGSNSGKGGGTSPLEWVVAGISALLVLGVAAFLLYDALARPETPPRITLEVDTIVPAGGGYLVEFRARNRGQATAAGLVVEGVIRSDTGTVEKSQVTISYVPAQGSRQAGLIFTRDPRAGRLEMRPLGYDRPRAHEEEGSGSRWGSSR
jgi:uncharacterized protein (TIGR02588 family)